MNIHQYYKFDLRFTHSNQYQNKFHIHALCLVKRKKQCSMSSQDIELQYQQNPVGSIIFTTLSFSYELNFSGKLEMWIFSDD